MGGFKKAGKIENKGIYDKIMASQAVTVCL